MISDSERKLEDKELLLQLKKSDEHAFEIIFKRYYAPMVLFAVNYLHDKDRSESIVQDVFVKLWEKRFLLDINSLKGYLVVAVRNRCNNEIKRQGVIRGYAKTFNVNPEEWPQFHDEEYIEKINRTIDELPPRRKMIFRMNRIEGLRYKEIAERLSISPKTVEVQMGKALKYLREKLLPLKKHLLSMML